MAKVIFKTYQNLVAPNFSTDILVNGKRVDISFNIGGKIHPERVNGKFVTNDTDVMKVLDESPGNGKYWICTETVYDISDIPEEFEAVSKIEPKENKVYQKIDEPKTVNQARAWLNKNKGVSFSDMKNRSQVLESAQRVNVEFVNVN
jgi:hypothetical protein